MDKIKLNLQVGSLDKRLESASQLINAFTSRSESFRHRLSSFFPQEANEAIYLQSYRTGFREVRVHLLHQSGYVYRSVGEVHFSFKVRTGTLIPGAPSGPYFPR